MAKEQHIKSIEVSNIPELLRLVKEVCSTNEPRLLRQDQDMVIVRPVRRATKRGPRPGPLTRDDSLFKLVGIGESNIPGGVSGKKHERFLEGYRQQHR